MVRRGLLLKTSVWLNVCLVGSILWQSQYAWRASRRSGLNLDSAIRRWHQSATLNSNEQSSHGGEPKSTSQFRLRDTVTGLRAYIDAVPLANATFGVKGKNEPPDATKTTWSDSNPVISVHNSSLIMHQPNDIETLQCVTLQRLWQFGTDCAGLYRKPGPDGLCTSQSGETLGRASQWLQQVQKNFALPSVTQTEQCPTITFADKPQRFSDVEFKCYSQNSEDGILLALLTALGTTNKRAIDIAGGLGWENNIANLVVNFGFDALFFDGDAGNSKCATNFFKTHERTRARMGDGVWWSSAFVTRDNINDIIANTTGWQGDIDVFSLDMDGIDLWIWEALKRVSPRIVVVKIQELWGPDEIKTRPYREDHVSPEIPAMGASLGAFAWLAEKRNYRLVGCMKKGFNAFFVRNDVHRVDAVFGVKDYARTGCFAHVDAAWQRELDDRRQRSKKYDWVHPAHANN